MYLKHILIENAGPIPNLHFDLPFQHDRPLPLVLVGPNGSGKSTFISFVVNSIVAFKQQAFDHVEIEQNKVYRVRSARFIRHGASWYRAKMEFDGGLEFEEWTLGRPRKEFEETVQPLPTDDAWKKIPEDGFSLFDLKPVSGNAIQRSHSKPIRQIFDRNVVLYFPSDRSELPDWLNEQALAEDLRFPESSRFEGETPRRIFSRALLKPTLEWLRAVVLDNLLSEQGPEKHATYLPDGGIVAMPGLQRQSTEQQIINFVKKVLARIFDADEDTVRLEFSHRNAGNVTVKYFRCGRLEIVPSLLSLSAGQAALFCAFVNVIRDFDLTGTEFKDISDISGIVLFDEADLHLHVDLQYRVLPELIKLFPMVQFIITAHSPLLVMGMKNALSSKGLEVREMPTGQLIQTEEFSEFDQALSVFTRTPAFDQRVLDRVRQSAKPVVITEGVTGVPPLSTRECRLDSQP